jgi:hypothetical protein
VNTGTMKTVANRAKPRTKVRLAAMASLRLFRTRRSTTGMVGRQLPDDERDERHGRHDGQDDDVPLREPVLGLAALKDRLERAQAHDEEPMPIQSMVSALRAWAGSFT